MSDDVHLILTKIIIIINKLILKIEGRYEAGNAGAFLSFKVR